MTLFAKDVMTSPVTLLEPGMSVPEAARILTDDEISGAPVVGAGTRLVGLVSKTDIVNRCLEGRLAPGIAGNFLSQLGLTAGMVGEPEAEALGTVDTVMADDVVTVAPDTPIATVATLMAESRIHRIVVSENERVLGIITSLDLISHWGK